VRPRNAKRGSGVYAAATGVRRSGATKPGGGAIVQSAHPRDIRALAFVVGLFLILFVVTVMLGSPAR
jgi:hypothetical protein